MLESRCVAELPVSRSTIEGCVQRAIVPLKKPVRATNALVRDPQPYEMYDDIGCSVMTPRVCEAMKDIHLLAFCRFAFLLRGKSALCLVTLLRSHK